MRWVTPRSASPRTSGHITTSCSSVFMGGEQLMHLPSEIQQVKRDEWTHTQTSHPPPLCVWPNSEMEVNSFDWTLIYILIIVSAKIHLYPNRLLSHILFGYEVISGWIQFKNNIIKRKTNQEVFEVNGETCNNLCLYPLNWPFRKQLFWQKVLFSSQWSSSVHPWFLF